MDIRIILFLIVFLFAFKVNKEGFVSPMETDIEHIEYQMPTYMLYGNEVNDLKNNDVHGIDELYEIQDVVDAYFGDISSPFPEPSHPRIYPYDPYDPYDPDGPMPPDPIEPSHPHIFPVDPIPPVIPPASIHPSSHPPSDPCSDNPCGENKTCIPDGNGCYRCEFPPDRWDSEYGPGPHCYCNKLNPLGGDPGGCDLTHWSRPPDGENPYASVQPHQDTNDGCNYNLPLSDPQLTPVGTDYGEWCNAAKCAPQTGGPKSIEFINSHIRGETIYVILAPDKDLWPQEKNDWDFKIKQIDGTETDAPSNPPRDDRYYYQLKFGEKLIIRPKDINSKPKFTSGNATILEETGYQRWIGTAGVNLGGLTTLEFTVDPDGSFTPDISMLEGINISVDMEISPPSSTGDYKRELIINNLQELKKNEEFYKSSDGETGAPPIIPKFTRREYDKDTMKQYALGRKCGAQVPEENCMTCPHPAEGVLPECTDPSNSCQLGELTDRLGCYIWWKNPENETAQEWLNIFSSPSPTWEVKGNKLDQTYRWVYDETMIEGDYTGNQRGFIDVVNRLLRTPWDPGIVDHDCYLKEKGWDDPECGGKIVKNTIQPSIMTNITRCLQLKYTIYDVLE